MGDLERDLKREIRRTKINSAIVATLAAGGLIAVAVLVPNLLQVLGQRKGRSPAHARQSIKKSLSRLIEKEYVRMQNGKAVLTEKGEAFAATLGEGRLAPRNQKRWDRKWRILVFDFKEARRGIRDRLRRTLIRFGFVRLQDSVWVYPFDCEDLVTLLKLDFRTGMDVLYIIADRIENDRLLRSRFNLA